MNAEWLVVAAWMAIFVTSHVLARASRRSLQAQQRMLMPNDSRLTRGMEPKTIVGQIAFAIVIFAVSLGVGGEFFGFFAGGYVVATAVGLGLNYHSLMFARLLGKAESGTGQLVTSTPFVFANTGHQLLGMALACLILGLALGQLALLGGALFLAATGIGYLRKGTATG